MGSPRFSDAPPLAGVSVIIPAYNYARYLPQAIESVLRQDHPRYEILVVDDGSTDNTAEVATAYSRSDLRVRYIYQKNAGLPAARNTGLRHARFDFTGFLDADDEWLPSLLRRALETFASHPPELAIVACRSILMDAGGATLNQKRLAPEVPQEITCRDIIFRTHFSPSTVVARKSALVGCGLFDETLRSSEDRDMWLRVAARWRVRLLSDRLARIRRHAGSMSKHSDRMKENMRRVIAKAYQERRAPRRAVFFWLQVFSFFYFQTAWTYYDEGRRTEAIGDMTRSLLIWPWFAGPRRFNEPALFRVRALLRFARETFGRPTARAGKGLLPRLEQPHGKA